MTKLEMLAVFLTVIMSSGIFEVIHAASIHSFDLTPTCFCTKELAPVCDAHGVEYSNICAFHCIREQNTSIVLGCSHSCPCDDTTTSHSITESTESRKITNFLPDGSIPDLDVECLCTKELEPVCDINGVQYSNRCTFRCINGLNSTITLACNHKCPCEETTSLRSKETTSERSKESTILTWDTNINTNSTTPEQENGSTYF